MRVGVSACLQCMKYTRIRGGNLGLFCGALHQGFSSFLGPFSQPTSHEVANDWELLNAPS